MGITLEIEHGVNNVLEHARTRERTLLGDMANEDDGDAGCLGEAR